MKGSHPHLVIRDEISDLEHAMIQHEERHRRGDCRVPNCTMEPRMFACASCGRVPGEGHLDSCSRPAEV